EGSLGAVAKAADHAGEREPAEPRRPARAQIPHGTDRAPLLRAGCRYRFGLRAAAEVNRIAQFWDDAIVPALTEYIRIPAKSPHFDRDWLQHGYIESAVQLAVKWCAANPLRGMKLEVVRLEGRTPVLLVEVPGEKSGNVLLYGHLDKQPEM